MLQQLSAWTQGQSPLLARLTLETFSGENTIALNGTYNLYSGWFPGASASLVTTDVRAGAVPQFQDPVDKSRVYVADPLNEYIVYTYATRLQRSAAFHLVRTDPLSPWKLSEIYYADFQQLNPATASFVDWKLSVYTGILPSSTTYDFKPPATARAIANVKGQGG